ncbi:MAG: hypothetical protein WC489_07645 [Patescibacteria group bacterium]
MTTTRRLNLKLNDMSLDGMVKLRKLLEDEFGQATKKSVKLEFIFQITWINTCINDAKSGTWKRSGTRKKTNENVK